MSLLRMYPNARLTESGVPDFLRAEATREAHALLRSIPGYAPTPLVRLDALARRLGVRAVLVKDESARFGLNAFKALGGLYAMSRFAADRSAEFVTATDGNHGRGVAWAAARLGCAAHVYMPVGSSEARAEAIRAVNPAAEVRITQLGYDDCVRLAADMAECHGWQLIQDTSWPGYTEIPRRIMQGYTLMATEAAEQAEALGLVPTHVLVQCGVGAMAGSAVGCLADRYTADPPRFYSVEPERMACIARSVIYGDGEPHPAEDCGETIMAGLNCGEPCTEAWPILRDHLCGAFTCPEGAAALGMRMAADPLPGDAAIVSGESGAVPLGTLTLIGADPRYRALRETIGLDADSVVLCFSTEGDTDPDIYHSIVRPDSPLYPEYTPHTLLG